MEIIENQEVFKFKGGETQKSLMRTRLSKNISVLL